MEIPCALLRRVKKRGVELKDESNIFGRSREHLLRQARKHGLELEFPVGIVEGVEAEKRVLDRRRRRCRNISILLYLFFIAAVLAPGWAWLVVFPDPRGTLGQSRLVSSEFVARVSPNVLKGEWSQSRTVRRDGEG